MSGDDDGVYLPSYTFRSQYNGDHLSIDAQYTLCGNPITETWVQVARGKHICNKCRRSEELLHERIAAAEGGPR